jgi:hypothetical protein
MDIVIIPPDNRVAVNGVWKTVPIISAGLGHEDIGHINAARLEAGAGYVEHRALDGYWPAPRKISEEDFKAEFSDILAAWETAKTDAELHAEQAEAAEEAVPIPQQLTKEDCLALVDIGAERARLSHITGGAGMALTYQEKKDQAIAVLGQPENAELDLADYPVLAASVGIEANTLREAATLVMDRYEAFAEVGGAIERIRLAAKKAIKEAGSAEEAKAIFEAVAWP